MRNKLVAKALSLIFMPYLLTSGLKVNFDPNNFFAILPKRRVNRNWYNTIAGGAILGNMELAAGAYLFMMTCGEYRMVCRGLEYRFVLPSTEAVMFKVSASPDELTQKMLDGQRFDIELDVRVFRALPDTSAGKRIGAGVIRFHAWPIRARSNAA